MPFYDSPGNLLLLNKQVDLIKVDLIRIHVSLSPFIPAAHLLYPCLSFHLFMAHQSYAASPTGTRPAVEEASLGDIRLWRKGEKVAQK